MSGSNENDNDASWSSFLSGSVLIDSVLLPAQGKDAQGKDREGSSCHPALEDNQRSKVRYRYGGRMQHSIIQ